MIQASIKTKSFQNGDKLAPSMILKDVCIQVQEGEIVGLYGASGCGKSTLLRIIAGLDTDFEGKVLVNETPVTEPTPNVGLTIQTPVAFDWLTVEKNILFSKRFRESRARENRRIPDEGIVDGSVHSEAKEMAKLVGLSQDDLMKRPSDLSGGMRQRMAFARALVAGPQALLLDEPFSALDYESRWALQEVVLRVRQRLQVAFVCVSHDPEELLFMCDHILVLGGTPATVIGRVDSAFNRAENSEVRHSASFQSEARALHDLLFGSNKAPRENRKVPW